jgi:heat shock protein 4
MILGIDIGNKFTTIASIRDGHIEIILNETSKRRTNTVISTDKYNGKRIIGDLANSSFVNNYENTITNVKYSMKYEEKEYNNIPIHQTLTGLLNYCVSLAKFETKGNIVLTVPPYFGDIEKQIYLDVAKITNLNISLCDEYSAVCQYYGFYNCKNLANDEKLNVVFIDIGDINTTLYYTTFKNTECDIHNVIFDKIGGLYIDQKIFQYFVKKIKEEKNVDIHSTDNIKATIKIFTACEKLKTNLSVSNEASAFVEYLYTVDDESYDYTFTLDRQTLNELIREDIDKLKKLLSNISNELSNIDRVELIGASSRVPIFKQVIEDFFGFKTSSTINAEETISQGGALKAASIASFVKMRQYNINEFIIHKTELLCKQANVSFLADKMTNVFEYEIDTSSLLNDEQKYKPIVMIGGGKTWHIKSSKIVDNKFYVESAYVNGILDIVKCYTIDEKEKAITFNLKEDKYKLDDETINKLKETEIKILKQNKYLETLENKRNNLEENIYKYRSNIDNDYKMFCIDEEKTDIMNYFEDTLDWLCDKDIEELDKKSNELEKQMDKFRKREYEFYNRDKTIDTFNKKILDCIKNSDDLKNNQVKNEYIEYCNNIKEEFNKKLNQENVSFDKDIEFTCNDMNNYIEQLNRSFDDFFNKDKESVQI